MASESIRSRGIFCDTSFFFAALVSSDPNHQRAKTALLEHTETVLATTWDIVSETLTLLRYRGNYRLALAFLTQVKPHLDILSYDPSIREEAEMVFKRFSKDKRLSFCDCISFVVLKIRLPHHHVFSFDRDFRQFGFTLAC